MKRILFFCHSSSLGGAERSMVDLIESLTEKGFVILVIIPNRGLIEKVLKQKSIKYIIINYCWWATINQTREEDYMESIQNIISHLPTIKKFKPDCIITNTAVIPWGALTAKFLNVPHIWNIREFVEKDHGLIPGVTFNELAKLIYIGSEKIWFVSEAVKTEFERFMPSDKSEVIYSLCRIPEQLLDQEVVSPFSYSSSFKLILSSNMNIGKGQDQAVKAVRRLIDMGYDVELLLLGYKKGENQTYFNKVSELINRKYKSRIHLLPFKKNPYPYFLLSNLVLVCSKSEALSRVIIESGLLGKPFIASDTGANKEIDKGNGFFYEFGNYIDLSEKIKYLINKPGLCSAIGNKHQLEMKRKFLNNKIILDTIPLELKQIKCTPKFEHSFALTLAVMKKYLEKNTFKVQQLTNELSAIKSSKNYKLWKKYHSVRDSIKTMIKMNNG